mmetsp:Transcript_10808/g.22450  ORF Transcript_10808/g.22450 Transcript_10808/m.22450 type:complete len:256 (-) Transcript_10808:764-1531(-)
MQHSCSRQHFYCWFLSHSHPSRFPLSSRRLPFRYRPLFRFPSHRQVLSLPRHLNLHGRWTPTRLSPRLNSLPLALWCHREVLFRRFPVFPLLHQHRLLFRGRFHPMKTISLPCLRVNSWQNLLMIRPFLLEFRLLRCFHRSATFLLPREVIRFLLLVPLHRCCQRWRISIRTFRLHCSLLLHPPPKFGCYCRSQNYWFPQSRRLPRFPSTRPLRSFLAVPSALLATIRFPSWLWSPLFRLVCCLFRLVPKECSWS